MLARIGHPGAPSQLLVQETGARQRQADLCWNQALAEAGRLWLCRSMVKGMLWKRLCIPHLLPLPLRLISLQPVLIPLAAASRGGVLTHGLLCDAFSIASYAYEAAFVDLMTGLGCIQLGKGKRRLKSKQSITFRVGAAGLCLCCWPFVLLVCTALNENGCEPSAVKTGCTETRLMFGW